MEQAARGASGATMVEEAVPAAAPLRESFLTVDGFLGGRDAQAMRASVDAHFADPQRHQPDTHQLWNYWHVPGLYTYLRTSPEKIIPQALVQHFREALALFARERLGMGHVTWPNLSLYVDGCCQHLHNDSANGRFGFVYSLTRDDRNSRGGETMLLREGDLFRDNLRQPAAGSGLYHLVEPRFDRLTIFDDRIPHGVQRVEGSMDPVEGRIVLHGHISEAQAQVSGPLAAEAVRDIVTPLVSPILASTGGEEAHGPLTVRLRIGADGSVQDIRRLVDRVTAKGGGEAGLVSATLAALRQARFPAAAQASEATLPIMFGGPLPWMQTKEDKIVSPLVPRSASAFTAPLMRPGTIATPAATVAAPRPTAPPAPPGPRAAIGAAVRERLLGTKGVAKIPKDRLEAFVVPDFVTPEECAALIRLIDAGRVPSGLLAPSADPEFRTSESCNLNAAEPVVAGLEKRINGLMGLDAPLGETVQGQRYAVGQQFKPHHDFFHTDQPYWLTQEKIGGQRTWTVMAFLNKPDAGGQTAFPDAGLKITPAAGYLLIWNNLDIHGEPNRFSLHQGMPVEAGVKYVITKWYRERPWGVSTA